jgi:tetratricopeptide (TPR) repeat protein
MNSVLSVRRKLLLALPLGATLLAAGCVAIPGLTDTGTMMQEGERLYREKRYDEAIGKFKAVIVREPTNWLAWLWLCRTYIVRALWGDAIEAGRQAFRLSPQGPEVLQTFLQALFGGGVQALSSGNFKESISHFSDYLKLNSGNGAAWLNVGNTATH